MRHADTQGRLKSEMQHLAIRQGEEMTKRFQQMQAEERVTLAALRRQGQRLQQIGLLLGRCAAPSRLAASAKD
ncbi:MAG: hypothetical protein RIQ53_3835 [Pseudomonadota bacterium]|jgi:hypothetical protein